MPATREQTHFGERNVALDEKQGLVDGVFRSVARRYDLMNDLMSGGLHRAWKDALMTAVNPPTKGRPGRKESSRAFALLDLAGGTGDVAFRVAEHSPQADILVADVNREMLAGGRRKAAAMRLAERVDFLEANAEELPLANGRFDAVTIAFGIRNVPRIDRALAEACRVLKPGGRFLCLEFSTVDVALLDRAYELYSFSVIPALGGLVIGDREPYEYLVESIRRFPNQARFAAMIGDAGFARVEYRNLSGGIAAIHSGWKI